MKPAIRIAVMTRIGFIVLMPLLLLSCVSATGHDGNEVFKIVNWNVLYGFNHHGSIDQGAEWLKRQDADVVALQELNGFDSDSLTSLAGSWGHEHAVILKEDGFPVGLTSRRPIEVIERRVKGFHHGYLHCKTYGIHFIVVHFWPGKEHEAEEVLGKVKPLLAGNGRVIVLGDFNTHSRKDAAYLSARTNVMPIYDVVDMFEASGFTDLTHKHDSKAKYSCPSPITIPRWSKTIEEVESKRQRIDFVFADEILQASSISGAIEISRELDAISDHYPVVVEFGLPEIAAGGD